MAKTRQWLRFSHHSAGTLQGEMIRIKDWSALLETLDGGEFLSDLAKDEQYAADADAMRQLRLPPVEPPLPWQIQLGDQRFSVSSYVEQRTLWGWREV